MTTSNLQIGGGLVFWSLCQTFKRNILDAGWSAAGFADKVPDVRPKVAVLKDAVEEVLGNARRLVRPLKSRTGWTVVDEHRGEDGNTYQTELVARICPTTETVLFSHEDENTAKVLGVYSQNLHRLQAGQVSNGMVRILQSLGGIRLRPDGGVYWLPGDRLDEWREAAQAVESSADGVACVYMMTHELKAEHVRAVKDAVIREVRTESDRLNAEILSGDLGERAIQTRKAELAALQQKVKDYEAILGEAIDVFGKVADANEQSSAICDLFAATSASAGFFNEPAAAGTTY